MLNRSVRMFIVIGCTVVAMTTIASAQRPQNSANKSAGCCTAGISKSYERVAGISRSYTKHVGKNSYTRTVGVGTNVARNSGIETMGFKDTSRRKHNSPFAGINAGADRNAGVNTYTSSGGIGSSYYKAEGIGTNPDRVSGLSRRYPVAGINRSYIEHVGKNSYTRTVGVDVNVDRIASVETMGFKDTARRKHNAPFAGINAGANRNAGINTYTSSGAVGRSYYKAEGINEGCRIYSKPRRR